MLEIKVRQPKKGECPACSGSGIEIPKGGEKRLVEVGRFCSECEEGSRLWEGMKQLVEETDEALRKGWF